MAEHRAASILHTASTRKPPGGFLHLCLRGVLGLAEPRGYYRDGAAEPRPGAPQPDEVRRGLRGFKRWAAAWRH